MKRSEHNCDILQQKLQNLPLIINLVPVDHKGEMITSRLDFDRFD